MKIFFPGELSHVEKDLPVSFFLLSLDSSEGSRGRYKLTNFEGTVDKSRQICIVKPYVNTRVGYFVPMSLYLRGFINFVHGCLLDFFTL